MDEHDMRNMILSELIDKMHGRMADKMFPDPEKMDEPAALPASASATESAEESAEMTNEDDDISEADLDAMMADHAK